MFRKVRNKARKRNNLEISLFVKCSIQERLFLSLEQTMCNRTRDDYMHLHVFVHVSHRISKKREKKHYAFVNRKIISKKTIRSLLPIGIIKTITDWRSL